MRQRPLSPHLMVYKPQLTSIMSISHRLTGLALVAGSVLLVWWLVALAAGGSHYEVFRALAASWFGKLVLLGFFVSISYHLANGIRHLFWDFGIGLSIEGVYRSGFIVLIVTSISALGGIALLFLV